MAAGATGSRRVASGDVGPVHRCAFVGADPSDSAPSGRASASLRLDRPGTYGCPEPSLCGGAWLPSVGSAPERRAAHSLVADSLALTVGHNVAKRPVDHRLGLPSLRTAEMGGLVVDPGVHGDRSTHHSPRPITSNIDESHVSAGTTKQTVLMSEDEPTKHMAAAVAAAAQRIWSDLGHVEPGYDATEDVRAMRDEDTRIADTNATSRRS
jgi:hypothetical protein